MSVIKQWVNLPKNNIFVGDGIPDIKNLDFVHFETKFKNPKPALYKVKIMPTGSGNIKYSEKEKKRHKQFNIRKNPAQISTNKKNIVEQDVYFPPAGGNQYKVKAQYGKKIVESKTIIEVWRRLFYQVISMKSVPYLSSMANFESAFENKAKKFCLELKEKDNGRNKMEFIKTIHNTNGDFFRNEARKIYLSGSIKDYEPYAVAVVFSNYIADYVDIEVLDPVSRSVPSKVLHWSAFDDEFVVDVLDASLNPAYLWEGLDDDHDKAKFWLISATFVTKDGKNFRIPNDDVNVAGTSDYSLGGYAQVKVNLQSIKRHFFSKIEGTIELEVNVIDGGFTGGFSYTSLNLITVGTRAWWDNAPSTNSEMLQTINHEMGHKIGMVAYGDKDHRMKNRKLLKKGEEVSFNYRPYLPDSPKTLYGEHRGVDNQGHAGPHCAKDVKYSYRTGDWSGKPGCVMFGSNATEDPVGTYNFTPEKFCNECEPVVRKLDLNGNLLSGLKNRF